MGPNSSQFNRKSKLRQKHLVGFIYGEFHQLLGNDGSVEDHTIQHQLSSVHA